MIAGALAAGGRLASSVALRKLAAMKPLSRPVPRSWFRTRRTVLVVASLAMLFGACESAQPEPWRCAGCNVVLISVDTLRADRVGAYGYTLATTPVLDELAERGVLFERAVSQSSWTRPAHMSMMTGLYPAEHGFVALADRRPLEEEVPTLASVLQAEGWQTVAFTGGINVSADFGFDRGFDSYRSNGRTFRDNLEDLRWWLDNQRKEDPFFLFLHGYDAHTPYDGFPADREALGLPEHKPRKSFRKVCEKASEPGALKRYSDEYDAAVHRADRYVGKALDELEQRGLLRNTLVVVTSDHGEELGEHGGCFHLSTLYREVLDVPLMFVGPGLAARRVPQLVPASVAIAPTIVEAVFGEDARIAGPSLSRALVGGPVPSGGVWSHTERTTESAKGKGELQAWTVEQAKLLEFVTLEKQERFETLEDPLELAPKIAEATDPLALELQAFRAGRGARFASRRGGKGEELDPKLAEQLRGLGYTE